MHPPIPRAWLLALAVLAIAAGPAAATPNLPPQAFRAGHALEAPAPNAAFVPGPASLPAPPFAGVLTIAPTQLRTQPALERPVILGRDARIFPGVRLEFFTVGDVLVPVARGEMVRETTAGPSPSYWRVIPQFGKVWRDKADGGWSRAAFPIMLVNDTENHAHQGLATFLYRPGQATGLVLQFVQQTAPYLTGHPFVAWGFAQASLSAGDDTALEGRRAAVRAELADRLPAKPWADLVASVGPGALNGFGGPLKPKWRVAVALVRDGTLYYQEAATPYGPYPYPLEMRFGVRSVTKSVFAPLALLRLAETLGPWVLTLKVGDYVPGLDPKWNRIRFIDAANMSTGFGGTGSLVTHPNDIFDGYVDGNYDDWYTAPSHAEKIEQIAKNLRPYPWEPGTVMRYRDQDYYLLGAAIEGFLKSNRGPQATLLDMVQSEVLAPIGIHHVPTVRTREAGGRDGLVWCNAGYYPTLDDLAKIALLYQEHGAHGGVQILNRELTERLLAGGGQVVKSGDASLGRPSSVPAGAKEDGHYQMGLHFLRYVNAHGTEYFLPTMHGSGDNEVIMFPHKMVSLIMAKASDAPVNGETARSDEGPVTIQAVERLAPF